VVLLRKITYFKLGGTEFHISKIVGAFLVGIALLMFVGSVAAMIESWDNLQYVNDCVKSLELNKASLNELEYSDWFEQCQVAGKNALNIYVRPGQPELTTKQFFSVLLGPISWVLVWLMVLGLGLVFYRSGDLVIPIDETVVEISPKSVGKKPVSGLTKKRKSRKK